jgi:hypothetical protein
MHSLGMYAQPNVAVQVRLKVAGKSVAGTGVRNAERKMCRTRIVGIGKR